MTVDTILDNKSLEEKIADILGDNQIKLKESFNQTCDKLKSHFNEFSNHLKKLNGKNLRSSLLLLTAKAYGDINSMHIKAANIIEVIHLATLIHDDVIDNGKIRRSLPSLNDKWGNTKAVLIGDVLFTEAFRELINLEDNFIAKEMVNVTQELCFGEIKQNTNINDYNINKEKYIQIIKLKTASLFRLSCNLGAYCSKASKEDIDFYCNIGENIGYSYQIYDDCLDLKKMDQTVGKNLGTDLVNGKVTIPIINFFGKIKKETKLEIIKLIKNNKIKNFEDLKIYPEWKNSFEETVQFGKNFISKSIIELEKRQDNSNNSQNLNGIITYCQYILNLYNKII